MRRIIISVVLSISTFFTTNVAAQLSPAITSWIRNTTGLTGYGSISANVQSVYYTTTDVYVYATSIPSYSIGPWTNNPNTPSNQNKKWKITLSPTPKALPKTVTGLGNIGVWSNGVGIFNAKDGMSYNNAGVWNRNALYYEGVSFDACLGHPAPSGAYHNHVNPKCLYDQTATDVHSPIIGYAFDGYPIYGAYAYTNTDGTGPVKRMKSSYRLPANISYGIARTNGPSYSATYPAGCYIEDYTYQAGYGDLDQYNGRTCFTPEYPGPVGTYAYFVTIDSIGYPQYPFVVGPSYYGTVQAGNTGPTGGANTVPANATLFSGVLPIELNDFSGINIGKNNKLSFTTASEINCKGFDIEYSLDGRNFSLLQNIASRSLNGNSNLPLQYELTDNKTTAGIVYYRLKQIDLNGAFKYSKIISIKRFSAPLNIRIYPNPITNNIVQFTVSDNTKNLNAEIIDAQGRVLVSHLFKANRYQTTCILPAAYLNPGYYWVSFESGGNKIVQKVLFAEE